MRPSSRLLLVALLFFAQIWAGAHAVEHAAGSKDKLATHVCELCLAAHDLGSALPSVVALPPLLLVHDLPAVLPPTGRSALQPPLARQGAPPIA
jgi:hypothetical protein